MSICFYEGYLRNRLSLCRELGLPDLSGERVVLEAGFRRWGAGLPDHLYGAFAFVFRLPESGAFFAARDHLGLQPLFYYVTEDRSLLFASNLTEAGSMSGSISIFSDVKKDRSAAMRPALLARQFTTATPRRSPPPPTPPQPRQRPSPPPPLYLF